MKKMVGYLVLILCSFFITASVDAAGAISEDEQMILSELTQPIYVQGKEFRIPETYITQTENFLKQNDLSGTQTKIVINNIQEAKNHIKNLKIDLSNIRSLDELIKVIPRDTVLQIQQLVSSTADSLGLVVLSWNQGYIELGTQNSDGATSTVFSSKQPIKQTGTPYISSFFAVGLLLVIAAGAFIIGKKAKLA